MRSFIFIFIAVVCAVALAQTSATPCECPEVKCDGTDPAKICQCRNSRETLCKRTCPDYVPTTLACPTAPSTSRRPISTRGPVQSSTPVQPPTPSSSPDGTCECEEMFCAMVWPDSCYCGNSNKQACYDKCGGAKPALAECPPLETPSLRTLPSSSRKSTTTIQKRTATTTARRVAATPNPTHAPCGGGRPNYLSCEKGFVCIKDPYRSGCGPECDGPGICVEDRMCGGFAGFPCREKNQVCLDDPRDDCATEYGGNDCSGLCVWPH